MNLVELRLLLAESIQGTDFAACTYFAGGCLRDELLGRQVAQLDADIAVELHQGGIRLARYLQQLLPTSEPEIHRGFGTASSRYEDVQLDFVMTRSESYPPGSRHPRVKFANLEQDCQRRDFTVNALYQELLSGKILDPCERGLQDLKLRLIRTVREPGQSFAEDPLRMLRALRFAVVLGLELEPAALAAIRQNAHLTATLSRRRCRNELDRLLAKTDASGKQQWLNLLEHTGLRPYLESRVLLT